MNAGGALQLVIDLHPMAETAVRFQNRLESMPSMTPFTATCPREGSFTLAFSESRSVDPSIVKRVASKWIARPAVRWGIVLSILRNPGL